MLISFFQFTEIEEENRWGMDRKGKSTSERNIFSEKGTMGIKGTLRGNIGQRMKHRAKVCTLDQQKLGREREMGKKYWSEKETLDRPSNIGMVRKHCSEKGPLGRPSNIGRAREHWAEEETLGKRKEH